MVPALRKVPSLSAFDASDSIIPYNRAFVKKLPFFHNRTSASKPLPSLGTINLINGIARLIKLIARSHICYRISHSFPWTGLYPSPSASDPIVSALYGKHLTYLSIPSASSLCSKHPSRMYSWSSWKTTGTQEVMSPIAIGIGFPPEMVTCSSIRLKALNLPFVLWDALFFRLMLLESTLGRKRWDTEAALTSCYDRASPLSSCFKLWTRLWKTLAMSNVHLPRNLLSNVH